MSRMASEEHVFEKSEIQTEELPKRKLEKTVLDNFSKIIHNQVHVRIKSGVNLLKHLLENDKTEKGDNELKYALGRIIRGLGSSTVSARTGFYTTLVALINSKDDLTVEELFGFITTKLHKGGNNSKGEKADICAGQILACGAIIRSSLFVKSSEDEQKKVIELLLTAAKERTYLSLLAYMFIINLFDSMGEKDMQKTVFPLFKPEISKPWAEQNLDTLHLLVCTQKKFTNLVKKTFLSKTLGTSEILCPESLGELCEVLMTIPRITALKHPVYDIISKDLAVSQHLLPFVLQLDTHLQRPNRNKHLVITQILIHILQNLTDFDLVPELLTKNFIQQTLNYFKSFRGKERDNEFQQTIHKFFETLLAVLKPEEIKSDTKVLVLKKLLLYPGSFIFEKITKSKIVQHITASLNLEGVKKVGKLYRDVVSGAERIDSEGSNEVWLNNDRLYAAHLLVKILNHPAMGGENDWRVEQLTYLMEMGLLKEGHNIGCELSATLKEAFFGALDMKLAKLEDLQIVLSKLVQNLNAKINPTNLETILRTPLTPEDYETWLKTIGIVAKIEKKKKKGQHGLKSVFLTLFLHMSLQLFNDVKLSSDSLKELFSCYDRIRKSKKSKHNLDETEVNGVAEEEQEKDSNDPLWIEVVVDLFLNLLSHNSHLLRSIIRSVFPHLCQYLNATSIHQVLSVLDPKNDFNPLSKSGHSSDEDEESDQENDQESDEEDQDSPDEEEDEESDEEEFEQNETSTDKLRMALQKALMENGRTKTNDDEESVNLDDLSEEEGEKLNEALAEAFKQYKPNRGKGKKQSKDQETLTHFRVRALDLIEIYLDSNPSMLLALEIMLPLLQAVEFSVRDDHQKPLLHRLKSCLKKLSTLKKFSNFDGVNEAILGDLLQSLLEKGTKNSVIIQDMGEQIADCCIFVVRSSGLLISSEATPKKTKKRLKNSISEIIVAELQTFFNKRDCLTPYVLFKNVLQLNWAGNLNLVSLLLTFVFNDEIKPFRRNQAVELLKIFYSNHRYLKENAEKLEKKLREDHELLSAQTLEFFKVLCANPKQQKVKERFLCNLFSLLTAIKTSPVATTAIGWPEIAENVREYRSHVSFSNDAKAAFNKLCRSLGVSNVVKMQKETTKLSSFNNLEDKESLASDAEVEEKANKKKKHKKGQNKEKLKLKKEAKALRLQSLSEGLTFVDFKSAARVKGDEDEAIVEDDVKDSTKKKRKNKEENGVEKKSKVVQNGDAVTLQKKNNKRLSGGDDSTPKKKKKKVK